MILIMGPSGAGKSSQAKWLANTQPNLVSIELGDELRRSQDTKVKQLLLAGELVNDDLVGEIIEAAIAKLSPHKEVVLDGFPRRLSQLQLFEEILKKLNLRVKKVVVLEVDKPTIIKRLGQRGREDDTQAAINKKWQIFHSQTVPVIEHFRLLGKVSAIDGRGTPAEVNQRLLKAIE